MLALQKTVSQQFICNYLKEREEPVANEATIDAEFWPYRTDMDANLGLLQASLNVETRRENEYEKEHKQLVLSRSLLRRSCDIDLMILKGPKTSSMN